eukprot:4728627-Amphidinium_carterae.1
MVMAAAYILESALIVVNEENSQLQVHVAGQSLAGMPLLIMRYVGGDRPGHYDPGRLLDLDAVRALVVTMTLTPFSGPVVSSGGATTPTYGQTKAHWLEPGMRVTARLDKRQVHFADELDIALNCDHTEDDELECLFNVQIEPPVDFEHDPMGHLFNVHTPDAALCPTECDEVDEEPSPYEQLTVSEGVAADCVMDDLLLVAQNEQAGFTCDAEVTSMPKKTDLQLITCNINSFAANGKHVLAR